MMHIPNFRDVTAPLRRTVLKRKSENTLCFFIVVAFVNLAKMTLQDNAGLFIVYCPTASGFVYNSTHGTCLRMATATDWSSASSKCHELHERAHLVIYDVPQKRNGLRSYNQGKGI